MAGGPMGGESQLGLSRKADKSGDWICLAFIQPNDREESRLRMSRGGGLLSHLLHLGIAVALRAGQGDSVLPVGRRVDRNVWLVLEAAGGMLEDRPSWLAPMCCRAHL